MRPFDLKWTAAFLIWFGATVAVVALNIYSVIPKPELLKSCFVARMNQVEICPKGSNYVPLSQISPVLRDAILVSEDTGFYHHNGFEVEELKESLRTNLAKVAFARGGSTITQQLARNLFLSSEKSILRKVKEAIITYKLESYLTKNEIFEKYLNVVEFGKDVYGIKAASRHYFSKSPSELTPLESAYLAFLLPSPKKYSASYYQGSLTKFGYKSIQRILFRLASYQKITPEQYAQSKAMINYFPWKEADLARAVPDEFMPDAETDAEAESIPEEIFKLENSMGQDTETQDLEIPESDEI
jgi:monofunctional glycosyltransferase